MGRKLLVYGGGLIALYLIVDHYSGAGTVISAGSSGVTSIVKAFQGR